MPGGIQTLLPALLAAEIALARAEGRPVRIIMAGKPHPSDGDGAWHLAEANRIADEYKDFVAVLPDYNLGIAKKLVAGCDVWLNTPVVGYEACGTSGMKAALNGAVPVSTKDGWVDEADLRNSGYLLDNDHPGASLCELLEKEIVPCFFARNAAGVPEAWEDRMRGSRAMIMRSFTATRMLREYVNTLYV